MAAVAEFPENCEASGVTWAPDGKRIAYTCRKLPEKLLKKDPEKLLPTIDEKTLAQYLLPGGKAYVIVADPDGKNPKRIFSLEGAIYSVDWR